MIQNKIVQDIKPINRMVTDTKSAFLSIDQTGGTLPFTNTIYNNTTVTYSSGTQTYGGISGALFGIKPKMQEVINL